MANTLIYGNLSNSSSEPLYDLKVEAYDTESTLLGTTYSLNNGSFSLLVDEALEFDIEFKVYDGETVLYNRTDPYTLAALSNELSITQLTLTYSIDPLLGISAATINASDELVLTYSDDSTENLGVVVGAAGDDGLGISAATINASDELVLTYSDDTTNNLGVVVGPQGPDGLQGPEGPEGPSGCCFPEITPYVAGQIVGLTGLPEVGKRVRIYDQILDSTTQLPITDPVIDGYATIDSEGRYRIDYTLDFLKNTSRTHADIVVKVFDAAGSMLEGTSPLFVKADYDLEVNMAIGTGTFVGVNEFDLLDAKIGVDVTAVGAGSFTDALIASLATKYDYSEEQIAFYVQAKHLQANSTVDPETFYALFRQGLPVEFPELLLQSKSVQQDAFVEAAQEGIINPTLEASAGTYISRLRAEITTQALAATGDNTELAAFFALDSFSAAEQTVFLDTYLGHDGTSEEFWTDLATEVPANLSLAKYNAIKLTNELSNITGHSIALITDLKDPLKGNIQSLKELTQYSEAGWATLVSAITPPEGVTGADVTEQRANYAKELAHRVEAEFPTAFLVERMKDDTLGSAAFTTFFDNSSNSEFSFCKDNVSVYLGDTPTALTGITDTTAITNELLDLERLYHITPNVERINGVKALLQSTERSALDIQRQGEASFVAKHDLTMGKTTAQQVFNKASQSVAIAQNAMAIYGEQYNNGNPAVIRDNRLDTSQAGPGEIPAGLPDLETLFGSQDYCSCQHCRSVYSPSAYLVDLLNWLDEVPTATPGLNTLVDDLFARRPEIQDIELDCDNTNTAMPYIDLVNEILENQVAAYSPNFKLQTTLDAKALRAHPEHINPDAYNALLNKYYPWSMPFSLWQEEAHTYLSHLGVSFNDVLQTIPAASGSNTTIEIAVNYLNMIELDRVIITDDTGTPALIDHYNDTAIPSPQTARWLMDHAQMTYAGINELLQSKYINPTGKIFAVASGCDLDATNITLTNDELKKLYRFYRLQQKLGWSVQDTDRGITAFKEVFTMTDITNDCLIMLADVQRLEQQFGLPVPEILSWFAKLDTSSYGDDASYFTANFVNETVNNPVTPVKDLFELNSTSPTPDELLVTTNTINNDTDNIQYILGATNLTADDLALIITAELPNDSINLNNLTHLFRVASFTRAMSITVQEYLDLKSITGAAPISEVNPVAFAAPADTASFAATLYDTAKAGFSIAEMNSLLQNTAITNSSVALDNDSMAVVLTALQAELRKIADKSSYVGDNDFDTMVNILSLLVEFDNTWTVEILEEAIAIIDSTSTETATNQQTFIGTYFDSFVPAGTPLTTVQDDLAGLSPITDLEGRVNTILGHLTTWVNDDFMSIPAQQNKAVKEALATELGISTDIMEQLLETYVQDPGTPANKSITVFTDPTAFVNIDLEQNPFSPANNSNLFLTCDLLYKLAQHISKLNVRASELSYLLVDGPTNGWYDLRNLTAAMATPATNFPKWFKMISTYNLHSLHATDSMTFVELLERSVATDNTSGAVVAQSQATADLLTITGWSATDMDVFTSATGFDFVNVDANYHLKEAWLLQLNAAFTLLARTEASAEQVVTWSEPAVTYAIAKGIINTSKSKHGNEVWLDVAPDLRDGLREKQRDALQAYLVASQGHTDVFALYEEYLIDTEMSACMMTTRIKQASLAVQLFVHRIMMNLEGPLLTLTRDHVEEWVWRKNYRVWEANRKVFLYPENWILPELRDNKSAFFEDLESELQQDDVDQETASRMFLNYVEKLDGVSNLEPAAMYNQEPVDETDEGVLHVFGRTRSEPHMYYYRQWVDNAFWTDWTPVKLDISASQLVPVVYNGRLLIFWPTFIEQADSSTVSNTNPATKYMQIFLNWSEYRDGKWQPKKKSTRHVEAAFSTADYADSMYFNAGLDSSYNLIITVGFHHLDSMRTLGHFNFSGCNEDPTHVYGTDDWGTNVMKSFDGTNQKLGRTQLDIYETESASAPAKLLNYVSSSSFTPGKKDGNIHRYKLTISPHYENFYGQAPFFVERSEQRTASAYYDRPFFVKPIAKTDQQQVSVFAGGRKKSLSGYPAGFSPGRKPADPNFSPGRKKTPVYYTAADAGSVVNNSGGYAAIPTSSTTTELATVTTYTYEFHKFYHPHTCLFAKQINRFGIEGLLRPMPGRTPEDDLLKLQSASEDFFAAQYDPTAKIATPYPANDIDFSQINGYGLYNWELFFHAPVTIAMQLMQNQKFAEAQKWFHYIFDPTETDGTAPQRYWRTKPFFEYNGAVSITEFMNLLNAGDPEMEHQVNVWRKNPFMPHVIARMRIVSYMKFVVMKYIDNLIAWGDQLFARDSMESLNEATQLYVLAAQILGRKPEQIERDDVSATTFAALKGSLDDFSNSMVTLENLVSAQCSISDVGTSSQAMTTVEMLYFCIPSNDMLLGYWDTVADRLFKIRNCQNIDGVVRQLPLFEPPIDPALLVKAAATGIDLASAISDLNAPMPHYRYQYLNQKALELVQDVKQLGGALLSALEKKDGEALSILRSNQDIGINESIAALKEQSIAETQENLAALEVTKKVIEDRLNFYKGRKHIYRKEKKHLEQLDKAMTWNSAAAATKLLAGAVRVLPSVEVGVNGISPTFEAETDVGAMLSTIVDVGAQSLSLVASFETHAGARALTKAGYDRRFEDWTFQKDQANTELGNIAKQIAAAQIRMAIAEKDLQTQEQQTENSEVVATYLEDKYTNAELYNWMVSEVSNLYFQAYKMAYDMAKKAEKAYRFELGLEDSNFIQFGYWDSLKKGLLSGERLHNDLKRLDIAFTDSNKRNLELTKHVSLAMLNPEALIRLREDGKCDFDIPEVLFDMDYPGHYMRRVKSISITIPCVTGPYTTISCTATMLNNRLRKNTALTSGGVNTYVYDGINDTRFTHNRVGIQSIATSSGQGDSGVFQLDFNDSRYLPFEGAGVVSSWRLELPNTKDMVNATEEFRQFDYDTISDVIVTVNYCAKDGGSTLKEAAADHVTTAINTVTNELASSPEGLLRMFSMKREFPTELYQFLHPSTAGDDHSTAIVLSQRHFPQVLNDKSLTVGEITLVVKLRDNYGPITASGLPATVFGLTRGLTNYQFPVSGETANGSNTNLGGLPTVVFTNNSNPDVIEEWTITADSANTGSITLEVGGVAIVDSNGNFVPEAVEDILLVFNYKKV